jgi:preprotein translocase subunit Sec61beta
VCENEKQKKKQKKRGRMMTFATIISFWSRHAKKKPTKMEMEKE